MGSLPEQMKQIWMKIQTFKTTKNIKSIPTMLIGKLEEIIKISNNANDLFNNIYRTLNKKIRQFNNRTIKKEKQQQSPMDEYILNS